MAKVETETGGCGCASLPLLPMLLLLGAGWFAVQQGYASAWREHIVGQAWVAEAQDIIRAMTGESDLTILPSSPTATMEPVFIPPPNAPAPPPPPIAAVTASEHQPVQTSVNPVDLSHPMTSVASALEGSQPQARPETPWEQKDIRGIYISRYQITNNASEQMIRDRVRYYKSKGINTIIHGVWGNGCTDG